MKKYLILPALLLLMHTAFCSTLQKSSIYTSQQSQRDSLGAYTGKYQGQQGMQVIYAEVTIEAGKLTARSTTGDILILDHLSGDNFVIQKQGVTIKFIRDAANKVSGIAVNGSIAWTRVGVSMPATGVHLSFTPADYAGKYKITVNGQALYLVISVKNDQLWATQLWDGGSSALNYVSGDDFIVFALSIPLKFMRDKNKKVTQLLLNGADQFTKVEN